MIPIGSDMTTRCRGPPEGPWTTARPGPSVEIDRGLPGGSASRHCHWGVLVSAPTRVTRSILRSRVSVATGLLLAVPLLALVASTPSAGAVSGAVSTTTNVGATTGNGACEKPPLTTSDPDPINCNHYAEKTDVWTTGLPGGATPEDGTYFFAVLAPGGQHDPNDGATDVLSTDGVGQRTFTISGGAVTSYTGDASRFQNGKLQLAPYADTPNPGGVYILAVCKGTQPVNPNSCKYDAFKVDPGGPEGGPGNPEPLTILKDAAGAYDQPYSWDIDKSVDKTLVKQVGGNATFHYTVDVDRTTGTPTNVTVTGQIDVFNPNNDDVVADVTDQLSDSTACTITGGGTNQTMASGDNYFDYSCSLGSLPSGTIDNTATVTWAEQTVDNGDLAADHADWTVSDVPFTGTDVNPCIDVSDTFGLHGTTGSTGSLGSACDDTSFTYDRTVAVPAHGCLTYDNTATFAATDDSTVTGSSDQVSVTVCGPVATGARTMGFWQNKNGQGIITHGPATAGVCNATPWLRQYAPFQGLSATATCSQVASYVANVIKAANASGASMNAMLKGQMLATALDVFYTGPGKYAGAQVFLPSTAIGSVAIDLTQICKNIPSCSIFENVSSAFGGATSLTVSQMLAYAASQSNAGGSVWYGQVKATQEKAKDAFDAINNEVAFGA